MFEPDQDILLKFLERAVSEIDSHAHFGKHFINFRCPCCLRNSPKNSSNKRERKAYVLKNDYKRENRVNVYCHKSSCDLNQAISGQNFLKEYFPNLYSDYRKEAFLNFVDNTPRKVTPKLVEKKIIEADDVKSFVPILKGSGPLFDLAISTVKYRKISQDIWQNFFVSVSGFFQGRLIIPYLDKDGRIYYYQGRSLIGSDPKYLNRRFGDKAIYGIYLIDKSLPVIILEGSIDCMFVENSISIQGLKFTEKIKEQIKDLKKYYLLDNDKEGMKNSVKLLENGEYVFNWKKFLRDKQVENPQKIKDVNDYVLQSGIEKFGFNDLKEYFTNSFADMIWFKGNL